MDEEAVAKSNAGGKLLDETFKLRFGKEGRVIGFLPAEVEGGVQTLYLTKTVLLAKNMSDDCGAIRPLEVGSEE